MGRNDSGGRFLGFLGSYITVPPRVVLLYNDIHAMGVFGVVVFGDAVDGMVDLESKARRKNKWKSRSVAGIKKRDLL